MTSADDNLCSLAVFWTAANKFFSSNRDAGCCHGWKGQGFEIVYAHVSKLNIENPTPTACIRKASSAQTARAPAKWTNMVACVRRLAGVALGVGGSRHQLADRLSASAAVAHHTQNPWLSACDGATDQGRRPDQESVLVSL